MSRWQNDSEGIENWHFGKWNKGEIFSCFYRAVFWVKDIKRCRSPVLIELWNNLRTVSPSLTVNENAIEQVTSAKSLGVYVDQNINWECHIENISEKIACVIGAIKRIRHLTSFNVLIKVYNSLIQPHFDYCNVVWGNCNKGLSEKLQRLQNWAARILMSASYAMIVIWMICSGH